MAEFKSYFLHDNGGRPFRVDVIDNQDPKKVRIFKQVKTITNGWQYIFHTEYPYEEIFIGKDSPSIALKEEQDFNAHPENFMNPNEYHRYHKDGNSILLKTGEHKYLYLTGYTFFSFETTDEITDFYAPIGNSDVPHPFAIGIDNIYILSFETFIKKNLIVDQLDPISEWEHASNDAMGWTYINAQWKLEHENKDYDKSIDNDSDIDKSDEKYGVIDFKESPEILQYKMDKYHVTQADIDKYKLYKKMDVNVIYQRK